MRLRNDLPDVWIVISLTYVPRDFFFFGGISDAVKVELCADFDKHDPYQECQIQLQTPVQQGAAVHQ